MEKKSSALRIQLGCGIPSTTLSNRLEKKYRKHQRRKTKRPCTQLLNPLDTHRSDSTAHFDSQIHSPKDTSTSLTAPSAVNRIILPPTRSFRKGNGRRWPAIVFVSREESTTLEQPWTPFDSTNDHIHCLVQRNSGGHGVRPSSV